MRSSQQSHLYAMCIARQFWELLVGSFPLALAALANHGSKLSRLNPGAVDVIRIEVNGAIWQLIALFLFATLFFGYGNHGPWKNTEVRDVTWLDFSRNIYGKKHGVYLGYRFSLWIFSCTNSGKDVDMEHVKAGKDFVTPCLLVKVLFLNSTSIGLV